MSQLPYPGANQCGSPVRVSSRLANNCLLTMSPYGRKRKLWSLFLSCKGSKFITRSYLHDLIYTESPPKGSHFLIPSPRRLGLRHRDFGEYRQSVLTPTLDQSPALLFIGLGASAKACCILSLNFLICKTKLMMSGSERS